MSPGRGSGARKGPLFLAEPGLVFKDITPVLANAEAFSQLIDELAEPYKDMGITLPQDYTVDICGATAFP